MQLSAFVLLALMVLAKAQMLYIDREGDPYDFVSSSVRSNVTIEIATDEDADYFSEPIPSNYTFVVYNKEDDDFDLFDDTLLSTLEGNI